jgi:hypothetical protein
MTRALLLGLGMAMVAAPAFAAGMALTSPDVKAGGTIAPAQVANTFGCKGENRSPALSWSGEPAGTQSFAVTMYDPDAPTGSGFWHWTMFNIPAGVHQLAAGAGDEGSTALPPGAGEGRNDAGQSHYMGPCPPPGPAHHYRITVYAVKVAKLSLTAESSGAVVGFNLHFNTLATGQLVGIYGRAK